MKRYFFTFSSLLVLAGACYAVSPMDTVHSTYVRAVPPGSVDYQSWVGKWDANGTCIPEYKRISFGKPIRNYYDMNSYAYQ